MNIAMTCQGDDKISENDVQIVVYSEKYCEAIIHIANEMFGNGYFSVDKIDQFLAHPNIFYVALAGGIPVGYCIWIEETVSEAEQMLKVKAAEITVHNGGDTPVCIAKSMAIDNMFQRRGIARKLFEACYNRCVEMGYPSIWGSAWKVGDSIAMQKIFDEFGFKSIAELQNIWYEEEEYKCAVCGGRCRCTGVIFVKSF